MGKFFGDVIIARIANAMTFESDKPGIKTLLMLASDLCRQSHRSSPVLRRRGGVRRMPI